MHTITDEQQWIKKTGEGDHRAFKKLYEAHVVSLFRFLRQYSENTAQVEDWVQRAFIKAYHNIVSFKGTSRFSTWLFTIALNEMKSDFRRTKSVILSMDGFYEQRGESEEEQFVWSDSMKVLLRELDEQKRSVFLLFEVEGYSHAEIASMLNIGENASRTLLCRAKQQLRTQWECMEKAV
ncbi:MAG: RNA polymerase sigma factor [Bacteroidetes bacterium]|nr:MAG: RNA polymerase sigma factor [Bacteroidota bacterium]